jgi:hypothetical protein
MSGNWPNWRPRALRANSSALTEKNLPRPIAFTRYTGRGDLGLLAADILALTKLDWNNDSPYNPLPVTLGYAQKLAEVVSNVPNLDDNVYQYRLFL